MSTYTLSPKQYATKILHLSQHMQDMSYKQDWTACIELEEQRQRVMNALFAHTDMPNALEEIVDILEQVIYIDSESLYLCEEARVKEMQHINKSKTRHKAAVSYLSHFK